MNERYQKKKEIVANSIQILLYLKPLPLNPPSPTPQKINSAEEHLIAEEEEKNLLSWDIIRAMPFLISEELVGGLGGGV